MGFGSIISAMVSVAAILLASYVCSKGGFYMTDVLADSVMEMQDNKNEMLKTEIEITNITTDGVDILVSLNNTGSVKIGDFAYMDVIVRYCNASGTTKTFWVPYLEGNDPATNRWIVKDINPDLVNPDILDPDEEMELQIRLSAEDSLESSSTNWLQVTAPNGVTDSGYFKG
ncbi:hypothetical protein FTO70_15005 [Methanosarcina sp. KYL-1]|uniref:hypothetical protein n=1 Tax=Methanosarcina sp. KYL-1 TaxID=2602068 RepID=UPI002100E7AA|nr:hypothetical protein [Methanosarcina sp. KYL-1]MCQ1536957.1 hypothetical protein [Methanosarcina sp. KYL-1]